MVNLKLITKLVIFVVHIIVFLIGLIGNMMVISVVFRIPRMQNTTNYFIANLAMADIFVTLITLPLHFFFNFDMIENLPTWACKLTSYISCVALTASVYCLIIVSIDRFLVIWYPLKRLVTYHQVRCVIGTIWLICLVLSIPHALLIESVYKNETTSVCSEVWPDHIDRFIFDLLNLFFLRYLLPVGIITLCYVMIWLKVYTRTIPTDNIDSRHQKLLYNSKKKATKMLVMLIIPFTLTWLPLQAIFLRLNFNPSPWENNILLQAMPIAEWFGISNSCINPTVYAIFNKNFRRGFVDILKSRSCWGKLQHKNNLFCKTNLKYISQRSVTSNHQSSRVYSLSSQSEDERSFTLLFQPH
ncbi:neuropeptide SIFamide receptor-like isoform X1 [Daktulosphaira vitifoliae]|uniref:neuropeptide SIFamide receptor-like isoform X1 n=1 Tax=Daktulosphaira vitifoliae TaxID=58002 RepID=UPI0021A9DEE0|nr:neuropeptide SIFamide receptor-like isoform X1 [Daktulosphaira vitifoliae]